MKSANWKQLTRAKKKTFIFFLLVVIGTIHLPLIELYNPVYRRSWHVHTDMWAKQRSPPARATRDPRRQSFVTGASALPALLIKHLWEPCGGHLGIAAPCLPARAGRSLWDCINITFSARRFMNRSDSEFLSNKEIMDGAKTPRERSRSFLATVSWDFGFCLWQVKQRL